MSFGCFFLRLFFSTNGVADTITRVRGLEAGAGVEERKLGRGKVEGSPAQDLVGGGA